MKVALALVGLFLGAIAGGVIGVGAGFLWTTVFHTSDFEGYSGMLVFSAFMPIGIFAGAVLGAAGLVYLASRDSASLRYAISRSMRPASNAPPSPF